MLSLITPQSRDPRPLLSSGHTRRLLDQAADPESLYWAQRAIALYMEGIKLVLNHQEHPCYSDKEIRTHRGEVLGAEQRQELRAPYFRPILSPPHFWV